MKSTNYKDEYKTPVLTAGQTFILGYTDETEGIYPKGKLPVVILGDFTTATKFVDFPFKVKSSAMKILNVSNKKKADIKFIFLAIQNIKFDVADTSDTGLQNTQNCKFPSRRLKSKNSSSPRRKRKKKSSPPTAG